MEGLSDDVERHSLSGTEHHTRKGRRVVDSGHIFEQQVNKFLLLLLFPHADMHGGESLYRLSTVCLSANIL